MSSPSDDTMPTSLAVGKPYPGHASLPAGPVYNFDTAGHVLRLSMPNVHPREVADVAHAPCEFALAVHPPFLFFLWRFGTSLSWSTSPYSWWLVDEDRRELPDVHPEGEPHAILWVVLVDSENGVVRAIRKTTLSPALTTALHLAIKEQAASTWDGQESYDQALADVYGRFPSTATLLGTARARSQGGR